MDRYINSTNYEGIGMASAPRPHSIAIKAIEEHLQDNADTFHRRNLRITHETSVNSQNLNDLMPDVFVYNKDDEILVLIEVTRHDRLDSEKAKAEGYRKRFPKAEIFILEYLNEKNSTLKISLKWHKLVDGNFEENNNYCKRFDTHIELSKARLREMKEALQMFLKNDLGDFA